jgi:quinol monooxygenase YgiN
MKARVSDHGLDERKNWMPSISKENKVVTLVNVFTVEPGNQQKVVDMLVKATETTMKKIPGFVSASIHKNLDGVRVVNYAQWRSAQDFEASPSRIFTCMR